MDAAYVGDALQIRIDKRFAGQPVRAFLETALCLPVGYVKRLFHSACVRIGRQVVQPETRLEVGQKLILQDPAPHRTASFIPETAQWPQICYEDEHLLVVNKPAGLIVHSDNPDDRTLDTDVALYYEQTGQRSPVFHVHRLDRPTTGAVLYAKHPFIARALDALLHNHAIERTYVAVLCGKSLRSRMTIDLAIGRDRHRSGLYRVASSGKFARTHVHVQASRAYQGQTLSLVECHLETGRTHQIRVHTSAVGAPIVGDLSYGGTDAVYNWPASPSIALHAQKVMFVHPYTEAKMVVVAPYDEGWVHFIQHVLDSSVALE